MVVATDSQNYSVNTSFSIVVYDELLDKKNMLSTVVSMAIACCVVLVALVFANTISLYYKVKNTREVDNAKLKRVLGKNPTKFNDRK